MLIIKTAKVELYNDEIEEFLYADGNVLMLEHSLISISKWESKWKTPYLLEKEKSRDQLLSYIECMSLKPIDHSFLKFLTNDIIDKITLYINDPMTATTFVRRDSLTKRTQIITSELIYYWMVAMNIPHEYEKWHLNRLLTLINICDIKNDPKKGKMSRNDIYKEQTAINEARKAQLNTRG